MLVKLLSLFNQSLTSITGGGCNFGVITEFIFKAHPQRSTVFVTFLTFPMEKLDRVVKAVEDWYRTAGPDEGCDLRCNGAGAGAKVRPAMHYLLNKRLVENVCLPAISRLKDPGLVLRVVYFFNGTAGEGRKAARKLYDAGKASFSIGKTST